MDKKQKIDAIYEAMADKTLSYGCLCWLDDEFLYRVCWSDEIRLSQDSYTLYRYSDDEYYCVNKIIWHPVLIGDVLEYIRLKNIWDINPITDEWDYPRLPIDEQSDDAISFVYNLIKK